MKNIIELLEEIRSIAQMGLNYTRDDYDKKRFEKLLSLTADQYSEIYDWDKKISDANKIVSITLYSVFSY